jgi:predicted secreted protein
MAITTAKGSQLKLGNAASPTTYATIGQVRSIAGPTAKPHIVDITTHDTAGFWRKKLAVLIDAGNVTFEVNFDSADVTHAFATGLWSLMVALTKRGYQLIFPSASGTLTFSAYIGDHSFAAPVDNVLSAKIELAITDAIVGA